MIIIGTWTLRAIDSRRSIEKAHTSPKTLNPKPLDSCIAHKLLTGPL